MSIYWRRPIIFRKSCTRAVYGSCFALLIFVSLWKYGVHNNISLLWQPSSRSLDQLDPVLHDIIRRDFLVQPPMATFYNLSVPGHSRFSQHGIEPVLELLFHKKKNGIFFEAGAYDGQLNSNTLYLERNLSWTGILVEPGPKNFEKLRSRRRNSVLVPACLSSHRYTETVKISQLEQFSRMLANDEDENNNLLPFYCNNNTLFLLLNPKLNKEHEAVVEALQCWQGSSAALVQCLPLYSILVAANYTTIDLMSLDIEGNEIDVLGTIPFEKVDIKVLLIEVNKMKDVGALQNFLSAYNYEHVTTVGHYNLTTLLKHDMVFKKISRPYLTQSTKRAPVVYIRGGAYNPS